PSPRENQGQPAPRIDGRLKVTGEARYAADFPMSNLAYAVLVTSDIARGQVTAIHLDAARAVPGVVDIISYGDLEGILKPVFANSSATSLGPLHQKDIFHDGQIIAVVVAETFEAASDGAKRVTADYKKEKASGTLSSPGTEMIAAVGNTTNYKEDP